MHDIIRMISESANKFLKCTYNIKILNVAFWINNVIKSRVCFDLKVEAIAYLNKNILL